LHYGKLLLEALVAGFVVSGDFGNAYDGKAFFSTTHQDGEDGPVQSNTGGATALTKAAYFAARAQMWELKDSVGDYLGIVPDTLIVGPSNEEAAYEITEAQLTPNAGAGVNNAAQGTARTIIAPSLSGANANKWFLASLNAPVKPLILQVREGITSSFEDATFMNKKMKFGSEGRHNVGFALWQHVYGNLGA
jgi:phage major head subunit gpT-like protein